MSDRLVIDGRFLTQSVTGVQRVGIEFCQALDQMLRDGVLPGLDVQVAIPSRAYLVTDPHWTHIRLVRSGVLRGHLWEQFELPVIARRARLLSLGNTAPLLSLLHRSCQTYVMVHDLSYRYFPKAYSRSFRLFYGLLIPIILSRARFVFTVSQSERSAIVQTYPRLVDDRRLVAVQNGSIDPPAAVVPSRKGRSRNCLYVGSLTKRKNAERLLSAAIQLVREHDAEFTFVGATDALFEGVNLDVPKDVAELIHFRGQVDDPEELAELYKHAAVFVFPSLYEASPLPPIEAMGYGCPVVVSSIPSLEERCGDAAVYCDPWTVASIVESTVELLDRESFWRDQQAAGLVRSRRFSWEAQARKVMSTVLQNSESPDV